MNYAVRSTRDLPRAKKHKDPDPLEYEPGLFCSRLALPVFLSTRQTFCWTTIPVFPYASLLEPDSADIIGGWKPGTARRTKAVLCFCCARCCLLSLLCVAHHRQDKCWTCKLLFAPIPSVKSARAGGAEGVASARVHPHRTESGYR